MTRRTWELTIVLALASALAPDRANAQVAPLRVTPNAVVTNAPYSADVTSTVTQVLSDGTRIEQRTTGRIYRDVAGRMRREQQVLGLGPLTSGDAPLTVVTMTDPTTRTTYTINDQSRTATKAPYAQVLQWNVPPFAARSVVELQPQLRPGVVVERLAAAADILQGARQGGGGRGARSGGNPSAANAAESLGSRQMEGVAADGTRTTVTIPTGQIGNDRPIVITDDVWESPELKVIVYSKHHDPRSGDVEYRLTNISRNEPPAQMFQVPAGYTVIDPLSGLSNGAGVRSGGRGGRGVPATPPVPGQPRQ